MHSFLALCAILLVYFGCRLMYKIAVTVDGVPARCAFDSQTMTLATCGLIYVIIVSGMYCLASAPSTISSKLELGASTSIVGISMLQNSMVFLSSIQKYTVLNTRCS